tara:strand:+ start:231 stop:950 length:720 start_codon:yes stop_codon:yes gene_type:complete
MSLIHNIKKGFNKFNIDVVKFPSSDLRRRLKLLNHHQIDLILDVGANMGQYAENLREIGYQGKIVSFEPLSQAYSILVKKTAKDKKWESHNFALGDKEEKAQINVSKNLFSSSLLDINAESTENAPNSSYHNKEEIIVKKLDDIYEDVTSNEDIVFLKLDVQGFEKNVLLGAEEILSRVKGIQIEMSLVELYKNEMLFMEAVNLLKNYGFELFSLENGFYNDKTGQLLQVDGVFFKTTN